MSMPTATARRPLGIGILSILMIISGVLEIVAGIILIAAHNRQEVRDALSDITESQVTWVGILTIVGGVLALIVAFGLRNGANWARLVVYFLVVFRLVSLIWAVITHHSLHWYQALIPTAIYVLVAAYLSSDRDVKAYFAR